MPPSENTDVYLYSIENVKAQLSAAPYKLGFYELRFYSDGKRPAKEPTDFIDVFFYYPSGGTLRDKHMNILFYEPKLDIYKDFKTGLPNKDDRK